MANTITARYDSGVSNRKQEGTAVIVPIADNNDIETERGFNQRGTVHSPNGVSRTVMGCGHTGNEPKVAVPITLTQNKADMEEAETACCLNASDSRKVFGTKQTHNAVCVPVITPDCENKRQNGRRFKENGDESFTLTAQDKHGVMIDVPIEEETENFPRLTPIGGVIQE